MNALFIPPRSIEHHVDWIVEQLESEGVVVTCSPRNALKDSDLSDFDLIAGPGGLPLDAELMDRAPRLRGLVSVGVGQEGFDLEAAARRGIEVARGSSADGAEAMASASIMLMLALCHDLPGALEATRVGGRRDVSRTRLIDRATIGLVGYGMIGREVARRLRSWGIAVQATSPRFTAGTDDLGVRGVTLDELLRTSDVVSLHATLGPASRELLGRAELLSMKPGALLVNTARGGLVDERALAEVLKSGHLAGAAIDCFAREPLDDGNPLKGAPNTILTPHQIGHTLDGGHALARRLVANIVEIAQKAPRARAGGAVS